MWQINACTQARLTLLPNIAVAGKTEPELDFCVSDEQCVHGLASLGWLLVVCGQQQGELEVRSFRSGFLAAPPSSMSEGTSRIWSSSRMTEALQAHVGAPIVLITRVYHLH